MKIKKVGKLLKKLNNLYDNIKDDNTISSIEKDLFLSYVKELYEHATGSEHTVSTPSPEEVSSPAAAATPTEVIDDTAVDHVTKPEPTAPSTHSGPPTPAEVDTAQRREAERTRREAERAARPKEREARDAARRQRDHQEVTPTVADTTPAPSVEAETPDIVVAPDPAVPIPAESVTPAGISDDMQALFTVEGIKEVSDRLRMQPISDMNRCMGINERIFTIRELFNNDDAVFNETMDQLNTMSDFESARDYLASGVASKYAWDDAAKSKKAGNFVKLVYRRYL